MVIRRAYLDRIAGVASSLAVVALCAVAVHSAQVRPHTAVSAVAAVVTPADATAPGGGNPDTGWG